MVGGLHNVVDVMNASRTIHDWYKVIFSDQLRSIDISLMLTLGVE